MSSSWSPGAWRRPGPDPGLRDPRSIGDSCAAWLTSAGLEGTKTLAAVSSCWEEVVGHEVSVHARPIGVRDGELAIAVDQPGWATELSFLAPGLLAALERHLGSPVAERLKVTVRP